MKPTDCSCGSMRILRAIENDSTEEFTVPAFYLKVSEVFESMSGNNNMMTSPDKVIELHGPIKSVRALVGWLTRDKEFQINEDNLKDLAYLSDKYIIDHLQRDLRNYAQISISRKDKPTMEIWKFAARYTFFELEAYCRSMNPYIAALLKAMLSESNRGLLAFSRHGIKLDVMNQVVSDLIIRIISNPSPNYCLGSQQYCGPGNNICQKCRNGG